VYVGLLLPHHDSGFDVEHATDLLAAVARPLAVVAGGVAADSAHAVKLVVRHHRLADSALPQLFHFLLTHRFDKASCAEKFAGP
jgi:hypothetical protein